MIFMAATRRQTKASQNSTISYSSKISLKNKITNQIIIRKVLSLDYLVFSETKMDEGFPTAQFNVEG